jgi:hypothetical protein
MKTTRLLAKSEKHTKPLETMVNNLLTTNGKILERIIENDNKFKELAEESRMLEMQKKANHKIITNLNNIIKGGC